MPLSTSCRSGTCAPAYSCAHVHTYTDAHTHATTAAAAHAHAATGAAAVATGHSCRLAGQAAGLTNALVLNPLACVKYQLWCGLQLLLRLEHLRAWPHLCSLIMLAVLASQASVQHTLHVIIRGHPDHQRTILRHASGRNTRKSPTFWQQTGPPKSTVIEGRWRFPLQAW